MPTSIDSVNYHCKSFTVQALDKKWGRNEKKILEKKVLEWKTNIEGEKKSKRSDLD